MEQEDIILEDDKILEKDIIQEEDKKTKEKKEKETKEGSKCKIKNLKYAGTRAMTAWGEVVFDDDGVAEVSSECKDAFTKAGLCE